MSKPNPHPHCPTCGHHTTLYQWRDLKPIKEDKAYRLRIKNLVAEFQLGGYDTGEEDFEVACAVAQIMAVEGENPHLQRLLAYHMERIAASALL